MGFIPAELVAGTTVVGTIDPVAGTIVPPALDRSPVGLSIALETTADNLYFQASGVMAINPNGLISLKQTVKQAVQALFVLSRNATSKCYITWWFYGHVQIQKLDQIRGN